MAVRYLGGGVSFEQKDVSQEFSEASSGSSLAGLTDVDISNPSNGDTLVYNSTSEKWENGECGGGSSTLSGLTDVDISNPTDGQTLVYNATSGKWENGGGGIYCIDTSVVPSSVTIDGVEYSQIHLSPELDPAPFYIIPKQVIEGAAQFYLKATEDDYTFVNYPSWCAYLSCEPIEDDPANPDLALTVTGPVIVGKTELSSECYLIPDTAEFKTVRIPR